MDTYESQAIAEQAEDKEWLDRWPVKQDIEWIESQDAAEIVSLLYSR